MSLGSFYLDTRGCNHSRRGREKGREGEREGGRKGEGGRGGGRNV